MNIAKIEEKLKIKINKNFKEEIKERIELFISNKLEEIEGKTILEKIRKFEKYINIKDNKVNKINEEFYKEYENELKAFLNPNWYKENNKEKKVKIKEMKYMISDISEYIKKEDYEIGSFLKTYVRNGKEEVFEKVIEEYKEEIKRIIKMITYFQINKKEEREEFGGFIIHPEVIEGEVYHYNEKKEEIENSKNEVIKLKMNEEELKRLKENLKQKKELAKKIMNIKIEKIEEEKVKETILKERIKKELNGYSVFSANYSYMIRKGRILKFSRLSFLKEYGYTYRVEKKEETTNGKKEMNYFNVYLEKKI